MSLALTPAFSEKLCRILDIDPSRCTQIDIAIKPNSLVSVSVQFWLQDDESGDILEVLKEYCLVEKPPSE
jgi:hypothetical protein